MLLIGVNNPLVLIIILSVSNILSRRNPIQGGLLLWLPFCRNDIIDLFFERNKIDPSFLFRSLFSHMLLTEFHSTLDELIIDLFEHVKWMLEVEKLATLVRLDMQIVVGDYECGLQSHCVLIRC